MNAVDSPATLWWSLGRCVIEVLVVRLQESIINLIKLVVEYLLRELVSMRRCVGSKQNLVLMLLKESPSGPRLASQLPDASGDVDIHVVKAIQILRHIGKILGKVPDMQHNESC